MKILPRAGAISCALLASTCLTSPALAQDEPAHRNIDANGVDLTWGDHRMEFLEGSIGSGDAEMQLMRDGAWFNGWNAHRWDRLLLDDYSTHQIISNVNNTDRFDSGNPAEADGATLTLTNGNYIHRALDGTVTVFTPRILGCTPSASQPCRYLPSTITAPNGKVTTFTWQEWTTCAYVASVDDVVCTVTGKRLASVSNSYGYVIGFGYAANGSGGGSTGPSQTWLRRSSASFYNAVAGSGPQASVNYAYPSTGVMEVTDTGGRVWRITGYQTTITGIRRPGATNDTTTITRSSGVTSVTRDGVTTNYSRNQVGSTSTMVVTDANSQQTTVVSDMTIGRPTSVTDPLNRTTSYAYDSSGRLTRVTKPEGNYTEFTYNARGNVTQTTMAAKSGSGLSAITTSASFDATCSNQITCNQPNSVTDARGNTTNFSYDPTHGGTTSVTGPAVSGGNSETRFAYTLTGSTYQLTSTSTCASGSAGSCVGTAAESRTVYTYDGNGNVASVQRRDGTGALSATTTMTYTPLGDLETVDGPLPGSDDAKRFTYYADRRLNAAMGADPDGAGPRLKLAAHYTYNAEGFMTFAANGVVPSQATDWSGFTGHQVVQSAYDANGRKVQDTLVGGGAAQAVTQYSYDAVGRVDCVAQRMNPGAFGSLPGACSLGTAGTAGPDRITKATYNAAGQQAKVTTAYGTADQSDDAAVTYTPNGQQQTVTDANGNLTTYGYDGFDRVATATYVGGSYEQYGYDANGNVTSRRLRDGQVIGYGYDALNRQTSKDRPNGVYWESDHAYTFDLSGQLTQASDSNGRVLGFAYDALGRQTSNSDNWYTFGNASSQYDVVGRRTRYTWADGFYVSYGYDTADRMTAIQDNGGNWLASISYDDLGRRSTLARGNGVNTSYSYDVISRLNMLALTGGNQPNSITMGHNPAGQITSRTASNDAYAWNGHANVNRPYGVNALNQYTGAGSVAFGYDGRGNLTSSGSDTYVYTADNQLAVGPGVIGLAWDPLGRLFNGVIDSGVNTTLTYDGAAVTAEIDQANPASLVRRYVYGPGTDEPLVWYEGAGLSDRRFLTADERGSIVSVTDNLGNAIRINSYDEHGIPAANNLGRFQYTGQKWLPNIGLYDYKARMYSPTLGRFMQTDPIGYADGVNWYNYVGSDPVNSTDPAGLATCASKGKLYTNAGTNWSDSKLQAACSTAGGTYSSEAVVTASSRGNSQSVGNIGGTGTITTPKERGVVGNSEGATAAGEQRKRVNCSSSARVVAKFSGRVSNITGGAAIGFAALGAQPVAVFLGGVAIVSDSVGALAGAYIIYTEGDRTPFKASAVGAIAGGAGGFLARSFGGSIVKTAPGVIVSKATSKTEAATAGYVGGQGGGNSVAQICQ